LNSTETITNELFLSNYKQVPELFTMEYIKENCPAFQKGTFCPYNVSDLKGLAKGCPAFKDGCPFKGVKDVGEFVGKMGETSAKAKPATTRL
jgi:hypothetical protein